MSESKKYKLKIIPISGDMSKYVLMYIAGSEENELHDDYPVAVPMVVYRVIYNEDGSVNMKCVDTLEGLHVMMHTRASEMVISVDEDLNYAQVYEWVLSRDEDGNLIDTYVILPFISILANQTYDLGARSLKFNCLTSRISRKYVDSEYSVVAYMEEEEATDVNVLGHQLCHICIPNYLQAIDVALSKNNTATHLFYTSVFEQAKDRLGDDHSRYVASILNMFRNSSLDRILMMDEDFSSVIALVSTDLSSSSKYKTGIYSINPYLSSDIGGSIDLQRNRNAIGAYVPYVINKYDDSLEKLH